MDEEDWRRLALQIRSRLGELLPEAEAERLRGELDRALALPPGRAKTELRRLLSSRPETRRLLRTYRGAEDPEPGYRIVTPQGDASVRFLAVQVPERVPLGPAFPLLACIARPPPAPRPRAPPQAVEPA